MMAASFRRFMTVTAFSVSYFVSTAQSGNAELIKKETRPYRVITSGKEITIKSKLNILQVMVWTIGGNRVVEQRDIHADSYSFTIPIYEKIYFLMVGLENGKVYTEKIGIQ
jgi:hypothetical protein